METNIITTLTVLQDARSTLVEVARRNFAAGDDHGALSALRAHYEVDDLIVRYLGSEPTGMPSERAADVLSHWQDNR